MASTNHEQANGSRPPDKTRDENVEHARDDMEAIKQHVLRLLSGTTCAECKLKRKTMK